MFQSSYSAPFQARCLLSHRSVKKCLVAGAALVAAAGCVVDEPLLDEPAEYEQAIIGGTSTAAGEFPGVAALLIAPSEVCTAALVHPDWVVTAAHCVAGKSASQVQVVFDRTDIKNPGGVVVQAAAITINSNYQAQVYGDNDIALIKLATSLPSRKRYAVHRGIPPLLSNMTLVGYGATAAPSAGIGVLRKLATRSVSCQSVGSSALDANVMCFDANDGNGTCFGDSGGPALMETSAGLSVVGVTSFGANTSCTGFHAATLTAGELSFLDLYLPKNSGGTTEPSVEDGGCSAAGEPPTLAYLLALAPLWRRRKRKC